MDYLLNLTFLAPLFCGKQIVLDGENKMADKKDGTGNERKAVLVLPDMGLSDEQIDNLKDAFKNTVVDTLKSSGIASPDAVVVVVVITF